MNQEDQISVIIPVYNNRKYLKEALRSVELQTYTNLEKIIINDGSSEGLREIIKTYTNVVYIENRKRLGVARARNIGIEAASSKYLAFLDSDDIWEVNKIETQLYKITESKSDLCFCNFINFLTNPQTQRPSWVTQRSLETESQGFIPSTMLAQKEIFKKVGFYNESYQVGSDSEWLMRAKEKNVKMSRVDKILVKRRIHPNNLGNLIEENNLAKFKMLAESIERKKAN